MLTLAGSTCGPLVQILWQYKDTGWMMDKKVRLWYELPYMLSHTYTVRYICDPMASYWQVTMNEACQLLNIESETHSIKDAFPVRHRAYMHIFLTYAKWLGVLWHPPNKFSNNCNHQVKNYCTMKHIPLCVSHFLFSNESAHCWLSEFVCIGRVSIGLCVM